MTVLEIKNEMLRQMRMDIWVDSNDDDDIVTNYTQLNSPPKPPPLTVRAKWKHVVSQEKRHVMAKFINNRFVFSHSKNEMLAFWAKLLYVL